MKFKYFYEATKKQKNIWYHGDPNKRENFCDQKMDRDPFQEDPNANGPGIYFTTDYNQARGYAQPSGYIYTAFIDPKKGYVIKDGELIGNKAKTLLALLKKAMEFNPEPAYYTVTDYNLPNVDMEVRDVGDVKEHHLKQIINQWIKWKTDLLTACVLAYKEFFGREANAWAEAMVEVGFLGAIAKQPEATHFIVYDCNAIEITSEEPYVPEQISEEKKIYEPDEKYHDPIPEIKYLPTSVIVKSANELEVSTVPDDVAANMDFSEPIEVIAFRYSSDHTDTTPEVTVEDGHHRFASAKQTGREWLPVTVRSINAKGYKINALIDLSNKIERSQGLTENTSMRASDPNLQKFVKKHNLDLDTIAWEGSGDYGTAFYIEDKTGKSFIIKATSSKSEYNYAKQIMKLKNAPLAKIYDIDVVNKQAFILMEWVDTNGVEEKFGLMISYEDDDMEPEEIEEENPELAEFIRQYEHIQYYIQMRLGISNPDLHSGNLGYNSDKELVAFDVQGIGEQE